MMTAPADLMEQDFALFSDMIRAQARERSEAVAIVDDNRAVDWRRLDNLVDRASAALQRDGCGKGTAVAIAAANSLGYAIIFIAALRSGAVPALITASATPPAIAAMIADSGAQLLFLDAPLAERLAGQDVPATRIALDDSGAGTPFHEWLAPEGSRPDPVEIAPGDPFNIIYSSGTTGTPKGIVQSHAMRFAHINRSGLLGYDPDAVTLISTPLYSNTTLVSFIPGLATGGRVVLMGRFDARRFLEIAERERVTHAMLVPVQYRRIMALPDFDRFDLSSFRMKTSTSAPFAPALKADVLARWPGALVELYGMTEGGGTCVLAAHLFPDKLHTVGLPSEDHDIRLIDAEGRQVPRGEVGEVVGRSTSMMTGYHKLPDRTAEAEWYDAEGRRYIRHGDIGRFDEDGFLTLLGRSKDLIISGGFNIYPSDLEAELVNEPDVIDAAVIGVPSEEWGETPVGFVVADASRPVDAILEAVNRRLGRTQRLSALYRVGELPRNAIGKVLKRELRERL